MTLADVVLRDVQFGHDRVDVAIAAGRVEAIAPRVARSGAEEIEGLGARVLPGLHDHHLHLLAAGAAVISVPCGPPVVRTRDELAAALAGAASHDGWVRGVDYHESVSGVLDRADLDTLRGDVAVRVQHRGGALWVVNSRGVDELALETAEVDGVERDAAGRATGRLWRLDAWLGERVGRRVPDLAAVSATLAGYGVTGVTDATPDLDRATLNLLRSGAVMQNLMLLGDPDAHTPWKIVVADHDLPMPHELADRIRQVRPRAVALHVVTRIALVIALAALEEVGSVAGDRLEHAAVVPSDLLGALRRTGGTVVTQPSLPALRGDEYLADVDPDDQDHLYPYASLLAAGVPVGCSSDAPHGDLDPWRSIAAAAERRAPSGREIAPHERVSRAVALDGYLSRPSAPGGPRRVVEVGAPADLVVVASDAGSPRVVATLIGGRVVHRG